MKRLKIFFGIICISLFGCQTTTYSYKRHISEEAGIKSTNSLISTSITFINKSERTVNIFWIDYQGKRKFYLRLPSGQIHNQPTFLTHPWLITDDNDNALWLYYPDAQARTIEIK